MQNFRRRGRFGDEVGENDCSICYECVNDPVKTACNHTFCRGCLNRWLHRNPSCPTCRRDIQVSEATIQAQETEFNGPPDDDPRYLDVGEEQVGTDGNRWTVTTRRGRNVWAPVRTINGFAMRNLSNYGLTKKKNYSLKMISKMEKRIKQF